MNNKKYQVFISSTYVDLVEERKSVHDALLLAGYLPVEMENFGSAGMNQTDYINSLLDQTDYYVLIIAGKYGSINKDGISYTEAEYDYAVKKGIPVLPFLYKDIKKLSLEKSETDSSRVEKLDKFRKKVSDSLLVSFYDSKEKLASQVLASLDKAVRNIDRPGWVRADQVVATVAVSSSISKDENVKRIMNAFGRLAKKNGTLSMVYMGMKEKDKEGKFFWETGINNYSKLMKEIDEAYDVIKFSITQDSLLKDLTNLYNMVVKAFKIANAYSTKLLISKLSGNEPSMEDKELENYEYYMKSIPDLYGRLAEGIRKDIYTD